MDPTLEQLALYVSQQLNRGMSEADVRAMLAQNRWTPEWIDAAFNVVRQNPLRYRAPSEASHSPRGVQDIQPGSKSKRRLLAAILVIVFIAIGVAAYMFLNSSSNKTPSNGNPATNTQPKSADERRKEDLNTLLSNLADYFVANGFYPTYDTLQDPAFLSANPVFASTSDPAWEASAPCIKEGKPIISNRPTRRCYAYEASTSNGQNCDNGGVLCFKMTITATLDNGDPYSITLDQNTEVEQ